MIKMVKTHYQNKLRHFLLLKIIIQNKENPLHHTCMITSKMIFCSGEVEAVFFSDEMKV